MTRIAIALLSVILVFTGSGCTWTRTYQEFPASASHGQQQHEHHDHYVSE